MNTDAIPCNGLSICQLAFRITAERKGYSYSHSSRSTRPCLLACVPWLGTGVSPYTHDAAFGFRRRHSAASNSLTLDVALGLCHLEFIFLKSRPIDSLVFRYSSLHPPPYRPWFMVYPDCGSHKDNPEPATVFYAGAGVGKPVQKPWPGPQAMISFHTSFDFSRTSIIVGTQSPGLKCDCKSPYLEYPPTKLSRPHQKFARKFQHYSFVLVYSQASDSVCSTRPQ